MQVKVLLKSALKQIAVITLSINMARRRGRIYLLLINGLQQKHLFTEKGTLENTGIRAMNVGNGFCLGIP